MGKKLIYVILLVLIATLLFTGCSSNQVTVAELQKQVDTLTDEKNKAVAEKEALKIELEEIKKAKTVESGDVTIVVVDKVNTPKDTNQWRFSSYSTFHISITNNTEKDIKGIQGVLDVQDMFGVSIMKSQCDLTGNVIKAHATIINKDLSLEINEFMDTHTKVYSADYDDLKFVYEVQQIMFTDGTTKGKS